MGSEGEAEVVFLGDPLQEHWGRGLMVKCDEEIVYSRSRYGPDYAARRTLYAVEQVLLGEPTALLVLWNWKHTEQETVACVPVEGQYQLQIVDGNRFYIDGEGHVYAHQSIEADADGVEGGFIVDKLELCTNILRWVEAGIRRRDRELTSPPEDELSCLYRDASEMVEYYREHGSLDGFELSRTRPELERFLFEQERYPRTERYVREHEAVICDVILEFLERDPDSETVEEKLGRSTYTEDWVAVKAMECMAEHPVDEAVVVQGSFWNNDNPEVQRAAARVLAELTHLEEARRYLRYWDDLEDERTREIAREALSD